MEHRACARRPSRVALEMRARGRKFLAQLFDLSPTGCSFDCSGSHLHPGDSVTFKLTEHSRVRGTIVRRNGALAGVQFSTPLPAEIAVHASGHRSDPVTDRDE
jgi:hypothetical protein